ncbi:HAD family hydrolase [Conexibacter woesei]|uniref:Haloacid dehalogenase domain protein hydrolase n=1 Tax=Conexibacter woesei (strain DSM 14684 / CCUG 47730 / CIP 108061 / JCM 11494 / NBRC 100937 / ID131577) TaxID=469383 RepID=D3FCG0_CONWI|nr:HAD family hydrolase [Conexibacter woesei]ADB49433.1 Haloacid dehalogenase domain protein hydrolase [Conexibacter woesei DSM 14684]
MGAAVVTPGELLLLFDIDGTLVSGATAAHAAALHTALHEVHGLADVEPARTLGIDPAGRTDPEIARLLLLAHGVSAERIDARADDVRIACCEEYARTCPPDLSDTVLPGIPQLLASLAERDGVRLALLTGNYEAVARVKLRSAGVGGWFEAGQGAFGSDSEDRAELPEIARERAGRSGRPARTGAPHPRDRTIVIGDTPRDVACALADGIRCLGVETGRFSAAELHGATAVARDARSLAPLIDALI